MYAQVRNNEVVARVNTLPKTFNNISNFAALELKALIAQGWYPVVQDIPEHNKDTERLLSSGYTIGLTEVIEHFVKESKPLPEKRVSFTKLDFRSLFTLPELINIEMARMGSDTLQVRATLQVLSDNLMAAGDINVTDERTMLAVNTLISLNLLSQERADVILGAQDE